MVNLNTVFIITILFFSVSSAFAQVSWVGEYSLGESTNKTVTEPEIYVPIRIRITEVDGKLKAHLFGQADKISIDIYANAVEADNKLNVIFQELGKYHNWRKFNKNDLLVSLEQKGADQENEIHTYWGEFSPITEDRIESGKPYFVKLAEKETEWIKIESDDKTLSLFFLKNFLASTKNKKLNSRIQMLGFGDGLRMSLNVLYKAYPVGFHKRRLALMGTQQGREYVIGDFRVLRLSKKDDRNYSESFYISSKKKTYVLAFWTDYSREADVATFVSGITLNGKPLFKNSKPAPETAQHLFVSTIEPSKEVIEALKRKRVKIERKITYLPYDETIVGDSSALFSRDLMSVDTDVIKPKVNFNPNGKKQRVIIKYQALANGQIGDMTVYSSSDKEFITSCVEGVKTIKFVPAEVDGEPVNSLSISTCGMLQSLN